jgi:lipoprotein-anchoring transpeptidase ErfK/SrfK
VTAYVKDLAAEYDTAYKEKKLQTSYGGTVEISKGFYGWQIDQKKEAEELYEILLSGESQVREPVYKQTAASHGENDYGDTYVEINLTAQHLHFYKDGQLVVESDFVSGNAARGYDTPSGAYPLTYKQRNAVLKGATYRTPVSYWMPFNRNIGMHDANWRGSFGGSIYKTNGSHGCINLPVGVAKTIFENIETGMPVLCYRLDGTENKPVKTGTAGKAAGNPAPETAPLETVPVETAAAETAAPETAPLPEESGAVAPPETETAKAEESSKETGTTFPWDAGPGVESWNSGEGQEESVEMGPGV